MDLLKANKVDFKVEANEEGFINPDNDPNGPWKLDPMDAPGIRVNLSYGITNPQTGQTFYPPQGRCWRFEEKGCTTSDGRRDAYYLDGKVQRNLLSSDINQKPWLKVILSHLYGMM